MLAGKISVVMTSEHLAAAKADVESGAYVTVSEVMRDAMRDWMIRQDIKAREIAELRRLWDEGIASGLARRWDLEKTLVEARRRLNRPEAAE